MIGADMGLLKNTTFITYLWIFLGFAVIALGAYREHLYREKDSKQQKALIETQNRLLEGQTALHNKVNELVKQGKITKEAAQEILTTTLKASSRISFEAEVIKKPSPTEK